MRWAGSDEQTFTQRTRKQLGAKYAGTVFLCPFALDLSNKQRLRRIQLGGKR
jgi:hypothetical protein